MKRSINQTFFLSLTVFFVLMTMLIICPSEVRAEKTIKLKVCHFLKEKDPLGSVLIWWSEELKKRAAGKVEIEYFFGGTLAKPPQTFDTVRTGIADVGPLVPALTAAKTPIFTIGAMPCPPTENTYTALMAAHRLGKTKAAQAEFKKNGLHFIGAHGHSGDFIFTTKQIKRLSDLKGMKISSFASYGEAFKAWGAEVSWVGVAETYEALKRGVVEGCNKPLSSGIMESLYEVTPYVLEPKMGINVTPAIVMNLNTWNKLPDDVKQIINQLSEELPRAGADTMAKNDPIFVKQMKEKGVTFTRLPDEDIALMRESTKPIWDKWAENMNAKGIPGTELKNMYYKWCSE